MARPRKYTDEQMIAALKATRGMIYLAADRIGCDADTIYNRSKVSPAVARCMKHERGRVVDLAEQKLFNGIKKGEQWAVQMALKTLGKDRGYVEKTEVESTNRTTLELVEEIVDAPNAADDTPPPRPT